MENINELYEICETISREVAKVNEKIRAAGGEMSVGDYDPVDKITHALKSVKASIKMMEDDAGGGSYRGYSREGSYGRGGNYSRDGGSYRGSYARGRGRNAPRDSMGRYSGRGYSRGGDPEEYIEQLQEMMPELPPEAQRHIQKALQEIEQM